MEGTREPDWRAHLHEEGSRDMNNWRGSPAGADVRRVAAVASGGSGRPLPEWAVTTPPPHPTASRRDERALGPLYAIHLPTRKGLQGDKDFEEKSFGIVTSLFRLHFAINELTSKCLSEVATCRRNIMRDIDFTHKTSLEVFTSEVTGL